MKKEDIKAGVSKSESRRKFLKTAGKFAVYTPPALMVMSKANALETICKSVNGQKVCKYTGID